jgi:transcriptional regulator with XRE-family HTH domain
MREAREAQGLGVRELADLVGLSAQMLSQWERGTRVPTVAQVALILGFLQLKGERREHILELARTAREPDWIANNPQSLRHCEAGAARLINWETGIVPGLLQTADYARAIFEASGLTTDQTDSRIATRMQRQKMLTGPTPVELEAILDERVLTDAVGNENIMSDQMDRLLEASELPHVSVRILGPTTGYHPGRVGSFLIMEYEESQPIVLLEHHRCSVFLSAADKVNAFRNLAKMLSKTAMTEEASRAMIAEAAR